MLPSHKNNFDFLRLFAALSVVFGHCYIVLKLRDSDPLYRLTGSWGMQSIGLAIFFVISGYLITKSYVNRPRQYLRNRSLRIFPALFINILITVFVIGPLFTTLSLAGYFSSAATYKYLLNLAAIPYVWDLPGLFINNVNPGRVNASLWTLGHEIILYIIILMIGLSRISYRLAVPILLIGAALLKLKGVEFFGLESQTMQVPLLPYIDLALFFLLGSAYYSFEKYIKYNWLTFGSVTAVSLGIYLLGQKELALYLFLPFAVICFAYSKIKLSNAAKYGDFSYGIYIYGYLIQQIIVQLFDNDISPIAIFALAVPASFICAFLSWHLIEKRALKLKSSP